MLNVSLPEDRQPWRRNALWIAAGIGGMGLVALFQRDTLPTDDVAPPRFPALDCEVVGTEPYPLKGETPYKLYQVVDPTEHCDPAIVFSAYADANEEPPLGTIAQEPMGTVINLPVLGTSDISS